MRRHILVALTCFLVGVAFAAEKRFVIGSFADPEQAEKNAFALNENFNDLCIFKVDASSPGLAAPRFTIGDLDDPEKAEVNAFAIMENLDDLWKFKLNVDTHTPNSERRFTLEDILNPEKAEDNGFAINEMFDDLWRDKQDTP